MWIKILFLMIKEDIKNDPIANLVIPVTTSLLISLLVMLLKC